MFLSHIPSLNTKGVKIFKTFLVPLSKFGYAVEIRGFDGTVKEARLLLARMCILQ